MYAARGMIGSRESRITRRTLRSSGRTRLRSHDGERKGIDGAWVHGLRRDDERDAEVTEELGINLTAPKAAFGAEVAPATGPKPNPVA